MVVTTQLFFANKLRLRVNDPTNNPKYVNNCLTTKATRASLDKLSNTTHIAACRTRFTTMVEQELDGRAREAYRILPKGR